MNARFAVAVIVLILPTIPAAVPAIAAASFSDGHTAIGAADGCWSSAGAHAVSAACEGIGGSVCGTPDQEAGRISLIAPRHGERFIFSYVGTHIESTDVVRRYPGAILRWEAKDTLVSAMPALDSNDGRFYVYVNIWLDGVNEHFRVAGAFPLPNEAHYEYRANGDRYHIFVDGVLFASFTGGPASGGWSGPGFLIGCESHSHDLVWRDYGWRSVGESGGCWTTTADAVRVDCYAPGTCGHPLQHAGWLDFTRSKPERYSLSYEGRAIESEDPLRRYPGAILRWFGEGDLVAAQPVVDERTGLSYLYVNVWRGGSNHGFAIPGLVPLPDVGTYRFEATGSLYQVFVEGLPFAIFRGGPSSGGYSGAGFLHGCAGENLQLEWRL